MLITEMIEILLTIKQKHGNLPVWIPYNYGKDDYKVCTRIVQQELYVGPFKELGEASVVLRNHDEDLK